ncbi:GH1 family beta-glucosidase [Bifidobacterium ramosum]|nr:GH1 family beta-glucosidase [Bifidobacterium ramosum]NEG72572.1 beta-glucosidase [Bifidobacterium ramosum]
MTRQFSDDFLVGAATAAYQIEGAWNEDGKSPSIWDRFVKRRGAIADGTDGRVACDHYHRLDDDIRIMADLGLDAYRFSTAWSRVIPNGVGDVNEAGLDFYDRLVDGLLAHDIKPVLTLYHWDLPAVLADRGGWLNRDVAQYFAEYAHVMAERLGDRVKYWTTLNEPWCASFLGYGTGEHAPGIQDPGAALQAAHHLSLAHGLGVQALRSALPDSAQISVVLNLATPYPSSDAPEDAAAVHRRKVVANDVFLSPMLEGEYPDELKELTSAYSDWSFVHEGDLETICQPIDALGINYYSSVAVAQRPDGRDDAADRGCVPGTGDTMDVDKHLPVSDMGWPVTPQGLTDLLIELGHRFPGLPLMITENGMALRDQVVVENGVERVHDQERIDYLSVHLEAVGKAMDAGVPVLGYFVWSLLDNFEWALGCSKRFGLLYTDYTTQQRIWKDSAFWYRDFAMSHMAQ